MTARHETLMRQTKLLSGTNHPFAGLLIRFGFQIEIEEQVKQLRRWSDFHKLFSKAANGYLQHLGDARKVNALEIRLLG